MLAKGTFIDWVAVDKALYVYMAGGSKSQTDFMKQQAFWESMGGLQRYFTVIDKKMYRNSHFDIPITLEEVRRFDDLIIANELEKIDWKMMGKDWGTHLKRRPIDTTAREWNDRFWRNYGGIDLYFDTDLDGIQVPRDFLRKKPIPIPLDIPEGATFVPRVVEPDKVIKQYSLNVSRERQSLPLGSDAKIVFCSPSQYGDHIAIWIQIIKDDSVLQKPSMIFAIFGDDETIAGGYKHVKSLLKKDKSMIHLCVWKPGESNEHFWAGQEIPD